MFLETVPVSQSAYVTYKHVDKSHIVSRCSFNHMHAETPSNNHIRSHLLTNVLNPFVLPLKSWPREQNINFIDRDRGEISVRQKEEP